MLFFALALSACTQGLPTTTATTGLATGATQPTTAAPKRSRPVVAGRPARMYVFAGFKEKDCTPVAATVTVATQPRQGRVEIRSGQTTTIMQSASGNCIGKSMTGTGVYYVPNTDADGPDSFSVTARTARGGEVTKSFDLNVTR